MQDGDHGTNFFFPPKTSWGNVCRSNPIQSFSELTAVERKNCVKWHDMGLCAGFTQLVLSGKSSKRI